MLRSAILCLSCLAALPAPAQPVPSGQPVELKEVLVEDAGSETWLRFRFLAPEIARGTGAVGFEAAEADLQFLCDEVALPYIAEFDLAGELVIVTLQDRPVEFGQSDPDATQFIDAFRVDAGTCIWEAF